jgi:tetratricopeptide (TPR) repeat protein
MSPLGIRTGLFQRVAFCVWLLSLAPGFAQSASQVDLKCRIIPEPGNRRLVFWQVEVRKSTGEPLRKTVGAAGDTVKFKDLDPGIYIVCVAGALARQSCQSIDLNTSTGDKSVSKDLHVPGRSANRDGYGISAARLSVPAEAREEMLLSEKKQLRGDQDGSKEHLQRALEICPDFPEALNNLGTYHHRSGEYDSAIELFSRSIEIDSGFFAGWVNLAGSLTATGKFEPALEAIQKALAIRQNDVSANSQAALIHFYMRKYGTAKKYFKKVASLDPASATGPQLFLAHISLGESRYQEAADYIRDYLDQHPNSPKAKDLKATLQNIASRSIIQTPNRIDAGP